MVSACYKAWCEVKREIFGIYSDKQSNELPLSQQRDFRSVKNMIIAVASKMNIEFVQGDAISTADSEETEQPNVCIAVSMLMRGMAEVFQQNIEQYSRKHKIKIDQKRMRKMRQEVLINDHTEAEFFEHII